MSKFERCNKVSGEHCPNIPVESIIFKIKVKPINGIVPLPRFEDYVNVSDSNTLQRLESAVQDYSFKWQQKVLSAWEIHEYTDQLNCRTEQHLKYHEIINTTNQGYNKLYTYVEEDDFKTGPLTTCDQFFGETSNVGLLGKLFGRLQINKHKAKSKGTDVEEIDGNWVAMHIMMDGLEENGDIEVLMKREAVLVSIYWNEKTKSLILTPDINDLEWNPYTVEGCDGSWNYQYSVSVSQKMPSKLENEATKELVQLLHKLRRKWERKHKHLLDFSCPPPNVTRRFYTIELLTAEDFEDDNIFIEYEVWNGKNEDGSRRVIERGRTHTACCGGSLAHFCHLVQFEIDCNEGKQEIDSPRVYMEVISRDWWARERSQGVALWTPPADPCRPTETAVHCVIPMERDFLAESRRFFLGGARLLDDPDCLALTEGHKGTSIKKLGIRCVTSGRVTIRTGLLAQRSQLDPGAGGDSSHVAASALFRSVDLVLRDYTRARERLVACRSRSPGEGTSYWNV